MIEVRNLTRKYGQFTAVDQVSFSIPKGQIVGLLGHNGAGKTTTLKVLTGFLQASSGSVKIDGLDLKDHMLEVQEMIGYLPENSPLYSEMTVVEYLDYVAQMRSIPEERKAEAIRDAVAATDLGQKAGERISTLSKGYKQRVGVAQAIIHKPKILILDEPTNGLDPTQIQAMRKLIKNLSRFATVILSTHIMQEVEAICDRVLIVLDGKLVTDSMIADLQKGNQIKLSLKQNLETVRPVLGAVSGVKEVSLYESLGGIQQYLVDAESDSPEIIAGLAKSVVSSGWDLYALQRDQKNLEAIFKEANRSRKGVAHV